VDEFKGDPNRVNRVLAERPHPLQLGGEPVMSGQEEKPGNGKQAPAKKSGTAKDPKTASN